MDKVNQWLTLLANLGVLLGIVFLGFEVQQNTEAIYSQTRATMYAGAQEELWKNMEYPDVTLNMLTTDHRLTPEEKIRLDAWFTASMRAREFAWFEYRSGNVDELQWQTEQEVIGLVLGTRRTRAWWTDIGRSSFHPEFAAIVDELILDQPEHEFVTKVLAIE